MYPREAFQFQNRTHASREKGALQSSQEPLKPPQKGRNGILAFWHKYVQLRISFYIYISTSEIAHFKYVTMAFCSSSHPQISSVESTPSETPQNSALWDFALWSLSSFAFGRTWFPAPAGGGSGESLQSPPSNGSKGFLNILHCVSKSSMNQNEADFTWNKKEIQALLHTLHLKNLHWNISPDKGGLGLLCSCLALWWATQSAQWAWKRLRK